MDIFNIKGGREARAGTAKNIEFGMRDVCGTNVEWNLVLQCGSSEFQTKKITADCMPKQFRDVLSLKKCHVKK